MKMPLYILGKSFSQSRKASFRAVEFWIVGSGPSSAIQSLTSEPRSSRHRASRRCQALSSSRPVYLSVPLRFGAGMKNKVLAAMAMQTPVVATPVSLEGIDVRPGKNVLVADGAEEFAKQIACLLTNRAICSVFRRRGF